MVVVVVVFRGMDFASRTGTTFITSRYLIVTNAIAIDMMIPVVDVVDYGMMASLVDHSSRGSSRSRSSSTGGGYVVTGRVVAVVIISGGITILTVRTRS